MGVPVCTSCEKPRNQGELFHTFPTKRQAICRKWEVATKILNLKATESSMLCADHFEPGAYIYPGSKKLKSDAVPTLFTFSVSSSHYKKAIKTPRKSPTKRRSVDYEMQNSSYTNDERPSKERKLENPVSPSKDEMREEIANKDHIISEQKNKIKLLNQQVRRKSTTVSNLRSSVVMLKEKQLLDPKIADNLVETFPGLDGAIIANHFQNIDRDNRGNRYSDEVKRFSLTLHFYSPRAFEYLRTIFNLPDPRSIRVWTSSVFCEPGFFEDVFLHLKNKISEDQINTECALIFDAMAIKKGVVYNKSTRCMEGFVDLGQGIAEFDDDDEDEDTIASEALIFLVSALRCSWKYVIGYVFIDKLNADKQYGLVARALELAIDHGMNVKTVTCDGTSTNMSTMKKFGCKIGKNKELLDGTFTYKGKTHIFTPDMPHMLKLGRNASSDLKMFVDGNGERIEWRFFRNLHEKQQREGLKYGNKLSNEHISYHRHKMNVKLAAQTFSSSVADALQFLQDSGDPNFQGAGATIKFVRVIDRLFDLLNWRNPFGKGFKAPMRASSKHVWERVITDSIDYLVGLKDGNGISLLNHRRNTFVKGMVITAKSALSLGNDLLYRPHNPFKFICFYRTCQDHVELLNSCIRGRSGDNNNPTVLQFKAALKKILLHAAVTASKYANCMTFNADSDNCSPIFSLKWSKSRSTLSIYYQYSGYAICYIRKQGECHRIHRRIYRAKIESICGLCNLLSCNDC